jgi:hypothetical protein
MAGRDDSFGVEGSFILWDEYPGKVAGDRCTGERSKYYAINPSTEVAVETVAGESVATALLGEGRVASSADLVGLAGLAGEQSTRDEADALLAGIPLVPCLFTFQFTVEPDARAGANYVVRLGSWGALTIAEEDLRRPGSVQLSVGLR